MSPGCRVRAETSFGTIALGTATPPPARWTGLLLKLLLLALWLCSSAPTGPWPTPALAGPCLWLQDQRARTHLADTTTHTKWPRAQCAHIRPGRRLEAGSASLRGAPAALPPHRAPAQPAGRPAGGSRSAAAVPASADARSGTG